ncbi:MAG: COX15/CtaA family protein [Candidatus Methylomirabilota bacterium]
MTEPISLLGRGAGRESPWPHRLALGTAGATFLLILAGGLVTTTGAGLAVPDWPTTFGYSMFTFPWSGMVGGIFYEHSHRLLGSLVGSLTILLIVTLWLLEPRRWLRWLGVAALALVILQGVIGGLRVIWLADRLAIIHAVLAQAFLALTVALTLFTSQEWRREPPPLEGGAVLPLLRLCGLTTGVISLQLVFGALLTHVGARLDAHLGLAGLLAILIPGLATRILTRHADRPGLVRPASLLCGLLILQLLLGLGAYMHRFTSIPLPFQEILGLVVPVSHRLTGALLLVTSLVLTLRVYRLRRVERPAAYRGEMPRQVPA